MIYGKNWTKITEHVGTRDVGHIRSHAQKFLRKLKNFLKKGILDDQVYNARVYFEILEQKAQQGKRNRKRKDSIIEEYPEEYESTPAQSIILPEIQY